MLDNIEQIIEIMASQDAVKKAVVNSHDNNPWWPNDVDDWRMKMIIAGLSTRVSFRMLKTYVNTINNFLLLYKINFIIYVNLAFSYVDAL